MDSGSGRSARRDEHGIVPALAQLSALTEPTQMERARMRARILAVLDSPDPSPANSPANSPAGSPASGSDTRAASPERPRALSGLRGRLAVAAVAVLALVGSLAGMSLLLAREALPGDALYGVKRTAEAAALGLTFGDEPKALKHLEFASARVSEIETLAARYPKPGDAPVGGYLTALADFDNDAAAGSRQLVTLATRTDGRLLTSLRSWAQEQADRLVEVAPALPAVARDRQGASVALLGRITARADALHARMGCYRITSGSHDDIGALPATGACEQGPDTGSPESQPVPPSGAGTTPPAVPPAAPTAPTGADEPLPPVEPTPEAPRVPLPGVTVSVPTPTSRPGSATQGGVPPTGATAVIPLPLPPVELPPLLPGLPGLRIGR